MCEMVIKFVIRLPMQKIGCANMWFGGLPAPLSGFNLQIEVFFYLLALLVFMPFVLYCAKRAAKGGKTNWNFNF